MTPTVSVVIPAYNAARTIGSAIKSVARQTFHDVEVIVVDDGSKDDAGSSVKSLGCPLRYVWQRNSGPAAARNRGAAKARGQFIAFLDADDLWLPRKLELQLEAFRKEPRLAAVQCSAYLVDDALRVTGIRRCHPSQDTFLNVLLFRNVPAFSSTLLVRKDRFEALGGFATDLIMETWDMACRLARDGGLRSIPQCLALYRRHPGNRSRNVELHKQTGFRSLGRLFADPTLDPGIRGQEARIWATFYAMLAGGYLHNGEWRECLRWAWRALRTSPSVGEYLLGLPARRLRQAFVARRAISFAGALPFAARAERLDAAKRSAGENAECVGVPGREAGHEARHAERLTE